MFSKTTCPYCKDAKSQFRQLGVEFKTIELDQMQSGRAMQQALLKISKQSTVPNIFINRNHVGGCSDLIKKIHSGEVKRLLDEAGVNYS